MVDNAGLCHAFKHGEFTIYPEKTRLGIFGRGGDFRLLEKPQIVVRQLLPTQPRSLCMQVNSA